MAVLVAAGPAAGQSAPADPARLAAARSLVQVLQTEQQIRAQSAKNDASATFDKLVPAPIAFRDQLNDAPGFAKARAQAIGILSDAHEQVAAATIPLIVDAEIRRYAEHFSLAELRQLMEFYRSPLGQKLVAEQPAMTADGQHFQQTVLQPIINAQNATTTQRLTPVLGPLLRPAAPPAPAAGK